MRAKGKKKGTSTGKQAQITDTALPLLKKPLDHCGKAINFPGDFWEGRMSSEEKATLYKCVLRDFSALHKWAGGRSPCAAFQLQEMGVQGTGSMEHGDENLEMRGMCCGSSRESRVLGPSRVQGYAIHVWG